MGFLHCAATVMPARVSPIIIDTYSPEQDSAFFATLARRLQDLCFGAESFHFISMTIKEIVLGVIVAMTLLVGLMYVQQQTPASVAIPEQSVATDSAATSTLRELVASESIILDTHEGVRAIDGYVSLVIGTTTHKVGILTGDTVIDAMQGLVSDRKLMFTGRSFPGLGYFIDSINGVPNAGGKYWVFYVNGASSTEGASWVVLSPGDVVEWRFRNKE